MQAVQTEMRTAVPPVGSTEPFINARDYGVTGDGTTDDGAALLAAANAAVAFGYPLVIPATFTMILGAALVLPSGLRLHTNGAKFYELAAIDQYRLVFNSNTIIDTLDFSFAGAAPSRGVLLQGDNISIESFRAVSRDPKNGYGNYRRRALSIGAEGGANSNINIDRVYVENWEYGPAVFNTVGCRLGSVQQVSVKQGLLIRDSTNVTVHSGCHKTLSTLVKGNPGENAVLVEATTADNSVADITIANFKSYTSGEHGFRLGGQFQLRNVTFENCFAAAAGMGIGSGIEPDNHGGSGFKVLGPTSIMDSNARHTNIRFLNCTVESLNPANASKAKDNFSGFSICKAKNVTISNPIIRAAPTSTSGYKDATYSAYNGIEVAGSENVTIDNPTISSTANAGISLYDLTANGSTNWGAGNTYVTINGGTIRNCANSGLEFINKTESMRNVEVHGTTIEAGNYGIYATPTASGLLNRCTAVFNTKSNAIANTLNLSNMMVEITGDEVGSNAVRNGSIIVNYSTGQRKTRANNMWLINEASGPTLLRPTGVGVGQCYFDTTLGKPVWLKTGTTWVDAAGTAG
jgi:hypothetical protein